jgi:uncharacterized cupin superfamily protein
MHLIHTAAVPVEHRQSPKGTFELFRQHMSLALGGVKDTGPWGGGHPFDVELTRLPAGKRNYPLHFHAAQTEYYVILSGHGRWLTGDGDGHPLQAGDHVIAHPGDAHQLAAEATGDLTYLVIADHHRADIGTYPKTGKRYLKPDYRTVRAEDAPYYEGEE